MSDLERIKAERDQYKQWFERQQDEAIELFREKDRYRKALQTIVEKAQEALKEDAE